MAPAATTTTSAPDCRACGACCANLPSNRAEGFTSWVEIEDGARILARPDLARLIVRDTDGVPHLRLAPDGRCLALRGALGRAQIRCAIYHDRPHACRRVQPGDADCERARREHGLA